MSALAESSFARISDCLSVQFPIVLCFIIIEITRFLFPGLKYQDLHCLHFSFSRLFPFSNGADNINVCFASVKDIAFWGQLGLSRQNIDSCCVRKRI